MMMMMMTKAMVQSIYIEHCFPTAEGLLCWPGMCMTVEIQEIWLLFSIEDHQRQLESQKRLCHCRYR